MRQASLISIVRKYSYSILLVTLFILLAAIASFQSREVRVQGEETETKTEATGLLSETESSEGNTSSSGSINNDSNSNSDQSSNSTKLKVSIITSTTNGETTGSTEVKVTTNGFTQDFSEILDECLTNGKIKISMEDTKIKCKSEDGSLEIDWSSKTDQNTKNESSFEQEIEIKNESD